MHIKDHSAAMKFFRTYDNVASKGKWKEFVDEMEFESMFQEPRATAQEPRIGLQGGQLVRNMDDGSRPGYAGKIQFPPPDDYPGTLKEWAALDKKKRFRWRHPGDVEKWNIKRKEKGGDWLTSDFSKRKFDKSLLEKIEKQIVKENVKTGKTRTLTQLLTDSGVPIRMAKHPSLRKNPLIKEATKDFLSLPQKVNNYLENVVLNADTIYDDIKYPMQHISKKFSTEGVPLSHKALIKYLEDNPLYKQNKNFLEYLGKGSVNKKYAGTGKTIGDMMFIIENRIPEPFFAVKGPDDFIMKSAYRSFMEGKQLGTGSSINFIGDPTMQNPSEWMFEHNGKVYAQNSALDKVDLPGDNRFHNQKINNLRIKNANKIYSKEFGEVYSIFDDLGKYRNTELINPRTQNKSTLDWMTREAYDFERGYPRDKIGVQVDHGKGLKRPFNDLRLINREMNQTAGNIVRQHRNNPKLVKKMLDEIGYNKPYNFDKFVKSETDRVLNVLNPKNFNEAGKYIVPKKPSMYSSAYEKVTKIKPKPVTLGSFPANITADMLDFRKLPDDAKHFANIIRESLKKKNITLKGGDAESIAKKFLNDFGKMGLKGTKLLRWLQLEYDVLFESLIYQYHRQYKGQEPELAREALWLPKIIAKYAPDLWERAGFKPFKAGVWEGPEAVLEKELIGSRWDPGKKGENLVGAYIDNQKRMEEISSKWDNLDFQKKGSSRVHLTPEQVESFENQQAALAEEYQKLEQLNKPDSLSGYHSAYTTALEAQETEEGIKATEAHKKRLGVKDYPWDIENPNEMLKYDKNKEKRLERAQKRFEKEQDAKRQKAMDDKFPGYGKYETDKMLEALNLYIDPKLSYKGQTVQRPKGLKKLKNIPYYFSDKKSVPATYESLSDYRKNLKKMEYYADNFRMEKAGGGIMSLKKKR